MYIVILMPCVNAQFYVCFLANLCFNITNQQAEGFFTVTVQTTESTGQPFSELACISGYTTTDSLADGSFFCVGGLMTNAPNCTGMFVSYYVKKIFSVTKFD